MESKPQHTDGSRFDCKPWVDAGMVPPSMTRWIITHPHAHKTLQRGDVVVMTETPTLENVLLREPDMSLHALQDEHGQYVHMRKASTEKIRDRDDNALSQTQKDDTI